jgi:hypothetical protein
MPFLRIAFTPPLLVLSVSVALALFSGCGGSDPGAGGGTGGAAGTRGVGGSDPGAQPDLSNISFVHNLLAKVDDGEWTLEEGLVQTLEAMAGERDAMSILRHPDLLHYEGTGILKMAYEYLDDGPDAEAQAEITRLLSKVVYSVEPLEAMAGLELQAPAPIPDGLAPFVRKGSVEDCTAFFAGYEIPPGIGNCLEVRSSTLLDEFYPGAFRVFGPALPFPDAGWSSHHFDLAIQALEDTVQTYDAIAGVPSVYLVLSATGNSPFAATAHPENNRPCGVALYTSMQANSDGDFKQIVAHEIAHCFQQALFAEQNEVDYVNVRWREEGLAEYLSNVVYPANNLEWGSDRRRALEVLAKFELSTTVLGRAYTNFLFFQHLGNQIGDTGIVNLVKGFPTDPATGLFQQGLALAGYPGMAGIYHDFAKRMSDKEVVDTSGQRIPYELTEINRPTAQISDPLFIMQDFTHFSVSRYLVAVQEGKAADVFFTPNGAVLEASRPTGGDDWGEIPSEMPGTECIPEVIVVVTTIESGTGYELEAPVPEDTEAACGIVGTWVVDLGSIKFDPGFSKLDYVMGDIRITFNSDGTADLVYSGYEYRFSRVTELYQEILELLVVRTEEYTYTTDATGMTTYQVDGNEIEFGHFSESAYLVGTKTVREVRKFEPEGIIGNNSDETRDRTPGGLGYFGSFVTFELDPGGSVMRILGFDDEVELVLNRTGSPP